MISVTAFILGICPPQRLKWLKKNVDNLDSQHFPFVKKIIAVDEFDGYKMPLNLKKYFESKGWIVLIDSHKSMIKSMDHAFSITNSEYIFCTMDDIMVEMPKIQDLTKIFKEIKVNGRKCGMISLTLAGSRNHFPANQYGDLDKAKENVLFKSRKYLAFRRLEEERNDWFFETQALFTRTNLLKLCQDVAKKKFSGSHVEIGLTKAWFDQKLDKKYYKCSLCNKKIFGIVSKNPLKVFFDSMLIEALDPNQGANPFHGNHMYGSPKVRNIKNLAKRAFNKFKNIFKI